MPCSDSLESEDEAAIADDADTISPDTSDDGDTLKTIIEQTLLNRTFQREFIVQR